MKIIFDSEEEKKRFFEEMARIDGPCPRNLGVRNSCPIVLGCSSECWEDCIPYEIKKPDMTFEEFNKAMLQDMHNFIKECEAKEEINEQ